MTKAALWMEATMLGRAQTSATVLAACSVACGGFRSTTGLVGALMFALSLPSMASTLQLSFELAPSSLVRVQSQIDEARLPALSLVQAYELALQRDPIYIGELATYRATVEKQAQAEAAFYPNVKLLGAVTRSAGTLGTSTAKSSNSEIVQDLNTQTTASSTGSSSNSTVSDGVTFGDQTNSSLSQQSSLQDQINQAGEFHQSDALNRSSKGWSTEGSLNLNWPIYRPANSANLAQSKLLVAQAELQLHLARHNVALRVSKAYMDVVVSRDALHAIDSRKRAIAQQLASAQGNFTNGEATIADVREAQAAWDAVLAQEIKLRNQLKIKSATLQTITGAPTGPVQSLDVAAMLARFGVPGGLEQWTQRAKNQAILPRIVELSFQAATQETLKQQGLYKPSVDLVANVGVTRRRDNFNDSSSSATSSQVSSTGQTQAESSTTTTATTTTTAPGFNETGPTSTADSTSSSSSTSSTTLDSNERTNTPSSVSRSSSRKWDAYVGVQVSVPLFDGGLSSSRVREALAQEDRRAADLMRTRQEASLTTETAYHELTSYLAEAQALKVAERSAEVALEASQLGYEVGMRTNADVLNAQQLVFAARNELGRVLADALQAHLRLKASVGLAGADDIAELSRWLLQAP